MRKIRFIALKEFYHILRDPRSLAIAIAMPVLMTFLYGYAINLDIENIVIAVADFDHSSESRQLTERFYRSTYFSMPDKPVDTQDPERLLRSSAASAVMIIRPGFAEAIKNRRPFSLGVIVDGSDNNLSAAVQYYSDVVVSEYMRDQLPAGFALPSVNISTKILYNPDLKSANFFVPGLVAIILMMISALLTSITIAREKETGTLEQLLTAPVSAAEILTGKIAPYIILALLDGVLVLVAAELLFGIPFAGSELLLLGFGLIYVSSALSVGILISSLVKTQQLAMMAALTSTMLPSVMLSGLIFAIRNMPWPLQALAHIVPAKYFVTIIRGIMLKGAGLEILAVQGLYLLLLMVILMTVAAKKFKTRAQ